MRRFISLAMLVMASALGLLGSGAPVWGQEALRLQHPHPTSVEESQIPTDLTFKKPVETPPPLIVNLPAFISTLVLLLLISRIYILEG